MKKLIPLVAAAALAVVPASALAATPQDWGGWQGQHSDNLASPGYATTFGNNGTGNSQYCVDPTTTSTHCGTSVQNGGTAVYSPVVFSGVFVPTKTGCSHEDAGKSDNNNLVQLPTGDGAADPCGSTSGDAAGAAYLGFAGNNTDGNASQASPVDPGQGIIGGQG